MTIHSVTPAWSRRSSGDESQDGLQYSFNASEGYQVVHSYDATEVEILSDSRVPQLGNYYSNTFALCKRRSVSKLGLIMSIVECEFNGEVGPDGPNDDPLNKPLEYEWTNAKASEAIDSDVRGRPIVTANGEEIVGQTMDICDSVLTLKKNFALFTQSTQQAYLHSVNSDSIFVDGDLFLPGTGKMQSLSAKQMRLGDFRYFEVTATIQFRYPYNTTPERAWYGRSRHEGFYERLGPVVTFTGGGGSGAEAVAFSTPAGVLDGVFVTKGGSGYTSTPTCSVSVGTGATFSVFMVTLGNEVSHVNVTAGGSGYRVRLVRAVDSNGEPTVKPVLLKANGFREKNPYNAVWVETQKYTPLPYAVLGFN
jgi:hypothetical protein